MIPRSPRLSAGVVVLRQSPEGWRLLLLRAFNHWDFPKGMVETGEEPLAAAIREVEEESLISDLEFAWGETSTQTGPYSRGKVARYYIARTNTLDITLPVNPELGRAEHTEYRWVELRRGDGTRVSSRPPGPQVGGPGRESRRGLTESRVFRAPGRGLRPHQAPSVRASACGLSSTAHLQTTLPLRPPRRKSATFAAISSRQRWRASLAAHAMWGVTTRLGMSPASSGLPSTGGSCDSTSMAAPPSLPPRSASASAAASTSAPRAVLISTASRFMRASCAAPIRSWVAGGERAVQAQHVHFAEQVVEVDASRQTIAAWTVRDQHFHAECGRCMGHATAERPVADDAEPAAHEFTDREVEQAELLAALPGARAHQGVVLAQSLREQQQHAEDVLHDRGRAVVAQVAHRDTALARRHEVHVVRAGRGQRDEPQRRGRLDDLARDAQLVHQHDLAAGDMCGDVLLRGVFPDLEARQCIVQRARIEVAVETDGGVIEEYRGHDARCA